MDQMPINKDEMMKHLDHVTYPASKEDFMAACNRMEHVTEGEKKWMMDNLPDKTYNSADEVKQALGM